MSKTTPGWFSDAKTKEAGTNHAEPIHLEAKTWTLLDTGLKDFPDKGNVNHAQVYFEDIPAGLWKFGIRTARGNGDDTAQHDFVVKGPGAWAVAYTDLDWVKHDAKDDGRRGIEVYAEVACTVQTRIQKGLRPLASDGAVD